MPRHALSTLVAVLALAAGCRGAVTARGMKALGPWDDRGIAFAGPGPGDSEIVDRARKGALDAIQAAGVELAKDPRPDCLVVRVREVPHEEGRETLLSSPGAFAQEAALAGGVAAAKVVAEVGSGEVRDGARLAGAALALPGAVKEALRVRVALELFAPERARPLGGVVWEGYRNLDPQKEAEKAGREAGLALASEIAGQRGRWVDRRPASERLFLTPTPILLERGEAVVSLDQALLLHAGFGVTRWLQVDAAAGGWIVPTAGGVVHSRRDGATAMAALGLGAKVRIADEGPAWPGISASYERLSLRSGGIGSGRIALLDRVVDAGAPGASSTVGLNVFTLAASKHPRDWLQLGAGALLIDNHPLLGSGTPVVAVDGTHRAERLPTAVLPYVNVEARAGEHLRLIGEYLASPGADALSLGVRTILFGSRRFGVARTAGWRARLDTAAVLTTRETADGTEVAVFPWIGVAVYPR